ncbi:carbon starvation protein A [candidate division KSB1 bacterium]|nr:carbon starvation protein A [candidate division KSB1 bacterium]
MPLLPIVLAAAVIFVLAYRWYGGALVKWLRIRDDEPTPAVALRDDVDFSPIERKFLLSQHFSAIAAAGPIVGPILAGVMFGWLPALLWIIVGSIFIGGVHDLTALVASLRHRARSIAEVVKERMSQRTYLLFLTFVWIALVYIIVAFTDIVGASFVGRQTLENGTVITGGGIATSSLLYLALPIMMGLLLRFSKLSLNWATAIFLPLVGVAIWVGQYIPLELAALLGTTDGDAQRIWNVGLLGYCFVASLVPMWFLLQPRGHLGGYFLYVALAGSAVGLLFGGNTVSYPAFTDWTFMSQRGEAFPLFPLLFITVACGACSGFHSLIASGTTAKQLCKQSDAKLIGYGAMLLEGFVAVVSLSCVMMLSQSAAAALQGKPNFLYAQGMAGFLNTIGIPVSFGIAFGLLAFTTFVYDTLDVCTRLGRYIVQELTGWHGTFGRWFATALTSVTPLFFVTQTLLDAAGNPVPAWRVFWPLFGASNQLLAALSLIGVTVWLHSESRARWVWYVTGLPAVFMYLMSSWALLRFIRAGFSDQYGAWSMTADPVPWVALVLLVLAIFVLVEALRIVIRSTPRAPRAVPA